MLGKALVALLKSVEYRDKYNLICSDSNRLDFRNKQEVDFFFKNNHIDIVILAASRFGGMNEHLKYRVDFLQDNLLIYINIMDCAYRYNVNKLIFIASTSVYPNNVQIPTNEFELLSGKLNYTQEPYSLSKIIGIKLCQFYNEQYDTNFISISPVCLYGENDNFDLEKSNVLAGIFRKIYLSKLLMENNINEILRELNNNSIEESIKYLNSIGVYENKVVLFGTGKPRREFLHVRDLADVCMYFVDYINKKDVDNTHTNIGIGINYSIGDLSKIIANTIGYNGDIEFDTSKPDGVFERLSDCNKIHRLGWKHKICLEQGLKELYIWYLKERNIKK